MCSCLTEPSTAVTLELQVASGVREVRAGGGALPDRALLEALLLTGTCIFRNQVRVTSDPCMLFLEKLYCDF